MNTYIALLRAVNVGGTGKLPMSDLKSLCESLGFTKVTTYIASGNVVFNSPYSASETGELLEASLHKYAGKASVFLFAALHNYSYSCGKTPFTKKRQIKPWLSSLIKNRQRP